jgi:hypothetical protein
MTADDTLNLFVELSSALTGYDLKSSPWAMDVAATYLQYAEGRKGADLMRQLLQTYGSCVSDAAGDATACQRLIGERLMNGDDPIPALARSILWLWYLSAWYDRPVIGQWPDIYPAGGEVVPGVAYSRGLAFQVGQAHPPGYTETRYGSWGSVPPPDPGPFYPPAASNG